MAALTGDAELRHDHVTQLGFLHLDKNGYLPFPVAPDISTETAIAIAFGLLSTILSLIAIIIGYLTLRFMTTETRNYPNENKLPYGQILRHEHTYFMSMKDKGGDPRGDLGIVIPG
ncbi:hypothetical protein DL98DRAFT_594657 [Cadophora sp. DSE1049]|nr:hypothetical protein DL98DRAFT_594657 [Cadophora sp. DSE1049]